MLAAQVKDSIPQQRVGNYPHPVYLEQDCGVTNKGYPQSIYHMLLNIQILCVAIIRTSLSVYKHIRPFQSSNSVSD